jgi:hypothetical protein
MLGISGSVLEGVLPEKPGNQFRRRRNSVGGVKMIPRKREPSIE